MLASRHKRLRTEYSKKSAQSRSFIYQHSQHFKSLERENTVSSEHRQTFISKIMSEITKKVNYEQLTLGQIKDQGEILKGKVKEMNKLLGKIIEKSIEKRNEDERIAKKAIIVKEMGVNYNQLCKEYVQNSNKINSLEEQFYENNAKLQLLSDPTSKINLAHKIAEAETKIRELKDQMLRIKKNKFLREREIIKGNDKDKAEVQDLQLQYITLAKKQQSLVSKLQRITQGIADSQFNLEKQRDYFEELRQDCSKIAEENAPNTNQEHLKLMYQSNKKKLEINMKRNERDEETKKRKYYNLLLEFQNCKSRGLEMDGKIMQKQQQNDQALMKLNLYMQELEKLKKQREASVRLVQERKIKEELRNGFMLTEVKELRKKMSRHRTETADIQNFSIKQSRKEKSSNLLNSQSALKKWTKRVEGSIVRQLVESPVSKKSFTEVNQYGNERNYTSVKNTINQPESIGKIRHWNLEPLQRRQFTSMASKNYEQDGYPQDFEQNEHYR